MHLDLFEALANSLWYRYERRLLVIGDEGHTDSTRNVWGDTLSALKEAGANLIVGTGTPFRSDGHEIIGFHPEVSEERPFQIKIARPVDEEWSRLETWAGTKRKVKLRADYEVTFEEAWNTRPSPLCKVSDLTFDVDLTKALPGQIEGGHKLSMKSEAEARALLGRVVRSEIAVRDGVRSMIDQLHRLRKTQPVIAAVVFCCDDEEGEENRHAKDIAAAITAQSHGVLRPVIATAKEGKEANDRIEDFRVSNVGDVLIVKQMAGVGLDFPRVKVVLDLSPVRGPASTIQRWFRGATPFGSFPVETLIRPQEKIGDALFDWAVRAQGGAVESTSLEKVNEHLIPKSDVTPKPVWVVTGTTPGKIQDSERNEAPAERAQELLRFLDHYPEIARGFTHAEAEELRLKLVERGLVVPEPDPAVTASVVTNATEWLRAEKPKVADLVKSVITARMAKDDVPYSHEAWRAYSTGIWREAKAAADLPFTIEYRQITDMGAIEKIREYAEKQLSELPAVTIEVDLGDEEVEADVADVR
jgi:hypothetical protein